MMNEVVTKLKHYINTILPGESYDVITGSFGRVKFAAIVRQSLIPKCKSMKTGFYELELCEQHGIMVVMGDEVIIDKRNILGVGFRLLKKELKCTCGSWAIKSNIHSDWCDIAISRKYNNS